MARKLEDVSLLVASVDMLLGLDDAVTKRLKYDWVWMRQTAQK